MFTTPNSARWPSTAASTVSTAPAATKIVSKAPYTFNKDFYDTSSYAGTTYDENALPNAATDNNTTSTSGISTSSSRRPNKYSQNKYLSAQQASGSGGSKTEKIVSKSSKSSPNLLSKASDYDHFYTDRYAAADSSSSAANNKWHTTTNNGNS